MVRVEVSVSQDVANALDLMVATGRYADRAEALEALIEAMMKQVKADGAKKPPVKIPTTPIRINPVIPMMKDLGLMPDDF